MNAKEAAKQLIKENFSIEQYELIQKRRLERLDFWKSRNVLPLIKKEEELVKFGEEVLFLLKEAYNK